MKKLLFAVAVFLLLVPAANAKDIYIVHEDMPEWATMTVGLKPTPYWFTNQYAYGVGIAPLMKNKALARTTAANRAREILIKGLKENPVIGINAIEIREFWTNPDNGKVYALARTPIKIIPAK